MNHTVIDYDELIATFCVDDQEWRPSLCQPNTIGDKTYASNGSIMIIVPNSLLSKTFEPHEKAPNFQKVIDQVQTVPPMVFKDTDLFKAMDHHPKEYGDIDCIECDGEGSCSHCGAECKECRGRGITEDKTAPKVYTTLGTIEIKGQLFTPYVLQLLQKAVIEIECDTFTLVGQSSVCSLFRVGPVEILVARVEPNEYKDLPNLVLNPVANVKTT